MKKVIVRKIDNVYYAYETQEGGLWPVMPQSPRVVGASIPASWEQGMCCMMTCFNGPATYYTADNFDSLPMYQGL